MNIIRCSQHHIMSSLTAWQLSQPTIGFLCKYVTACDVAVTYMHYKKLSSESCLQRRFMKQMKHMYKTHGISPR